MSKHISIPPSEAAERFAIRELIETYAHCVDRRNSKGQMARFTLWPTVLGELNA